jgi:hypothetical protein
MNLRSCPLAAALVALATALPSSDARACGGCFHEQTQTQSTVVTGHRMAFALSTTHTVLWDQIKYAGAPSEFAWVLPVKAGAVLELGSDAWFETLDAATTAQIVSPPINCGYSGGGSSGCGIGCGASAAGEALPLDGDRGTPPAVTVTHEGTVGPYETVTLHANVPDALPAWLTSHNYAIDPSVKPIIDAYTAEGFDFIALRLLPGAGVQQMKPVRVVTPGMSPTLPLRMVAAGTGAKVAITLFVIGEGRWEAQNFPNAAIDASKLTWDFTTQSSNYASARDTLLAGNGGKTWNSAFANKGSLLTQDTSGGNGLVITVGGAQFSTFGSAYVQQGVNDGETTTTSCTSAFSFFAASTAQVSGACLGGAGTGGTGTGGAGTGGAGTGGAGTGGVGTGGAGTGTGGAATCVLPVGQLDASQLACGPLDDLAVAMVGLHPSDVWLTRLEANLPRAALATDLTLQASASQTPVSSVFTLSASTGDPCATTVGMMARRDGERLALRNRLAILATVLAAVGATFARRRRRSPLFPARAHA